MTIPFWKMSGSGNDFIVIDHRKPLLPPSQIPEFVMRVCRRGLSVGADGVIFVTTSTRAHYAWHFYNADGGEAEMCGNGSRCVARFAMLTGIAPARHTFETLAGLIHAEVLPEGRVRVGLPDPSNLKLNLTLDLEGETHLGHAVNTGVPHLVYFVEDLERLDLVRLGRATRYHRQFAPAGTNVNFVRPIDPHTLQIRTYERGVEDETLACGTGAIAASLVGAALGKVLPPVTLQTRSGILLGVDFKQAGEQYTDISLTGDARMIIQGELMEEAWQ